MTRALLIATLMYTIGYGVGCVRAGFVSDRCSTGDASRDTTEADAVMSDALVPLPTFGSPTLVPGVDSTASDDGPHLSLDGRRLYFSSSRQGGGSNIWLAVRPDVSSGFGTPALVTSVSTAQDEKDPTLTDDELTILFERKSSGDTKIWMATRTSITSAFDPPQRVEALASAFEDEDPSISGDGLAVVFASERLAGNSDIWIATRATKSSVFTTPVRISALSTAATEKNPAFAGKHFIVFDSERGDVGGRDIYIARSINGPALFETPTLISAVNSPQYDGDAFLHVGLRILIFSSERSGKEQLYWSTY